jgi:hypothetical protein
MTMSSARKFKQLAIIFVLACVSVVSFQNCGADFAVREGLSLSSSGLACEAQLKSQFESTYAPWLQTNCSNCHVTGPGKGSFASSNTTTSFSAFLLATSDRIDTLAVSSSHAAPFTGTQNQEAINAVSGSWNQAVDACKAGTGQTDTSGAATIAKSMAATATDKDLTWNLDSELQTGAEDLGGATLTIAVRVVTANGYTTYFFNRPRLKAGTRPIHIGKMMLKINNQMQSLGTTWSQLDAVVPAGQTVTLSTSQLFLEYFPTTDDKLSISLGTLEAQ